PLGRDRLRCAIGQLAAGARIDDIRAEGLNLEHGEAAVGQPVGREAYYAVDAVEARSAGQVGGCVALAGLISAQRNCEAHRIIGEACEARRRGAERAREALREVLPAMGIRGGIPAAGQRRIAAGVGVVPASSADQLDLLCVETRVAYERPDLLQDLG